VSDSHWPLEGRRLLSELANGVHRGGDREVRDSVGRGDVRVQALRSDPTRLWKMACRRSQ